MDSAKSTAGGLSEFEHRGVWRVRRSMAFLVFPVPMLADRVCHFCQPGTILHQFHDLLRGEVLDAILRGIAQRLEQSGRNKNRHIMRLAAKHPGSLFHGKPGRGLPDQRQELMLLLFHTHCLCANRSRPRQLQPLVTTSNPVQRASTRSLGPETGGRALRARPPAPGQGIPGEFDTRDSSFRVLSLPSDGGLSALFLPNRGGYAPFGQNSYHARRQRGGLIANTTLSGTASKPWGTAPLRQEQPPDPQAQRHPTFHNPPVFSCVLTAASVSTRINTRYQTDNRCRQRHRIRKAVLVQLVGICPKAFCHVSRSSQ